ncbi:MAG: glucose-6-phosphate dehydrogenase assembly protein OpcA [Ktedonobacteraceae bacterium]|nr:glucose-6-phosphate dehydrogenase assembly protein OpcA [Ktedonobacteraceae bacterium]MBO0789994.1 glucose-6-phosphate dehydrogenase assembly protein OpcA [Ktedonobacteraceae bacterium]
MDIVKQNAENTGPRLPWAGKRVRIEQVEDELAHLWHLTADNVRISQNINVRTSVLNFVICAPDIGSAQRASMLLRDLSSTHIARVFLLILDTSGLPSQTTTWVTLRSFPIVSDVMRHHFEQVTILASGAAVYDSPHLIEPLFKPDLPVYLWWLQDLPYNNATFNRYVNICSRVIIDSSTFEEAGSSFQVLLSLIKPSTAYAISDLNWGRLTPWRELVAQFFDVADYKPYLGGVNRIEIEYAAPPGQTRRLGDTPFYSTQAMLLAAWLKNSLAWEFTHGSTLDEHDPRSGTYAWHMSRTSGPLANDQATGKLGILVSGDIALRPRTETGLQPGTICSVRLSSELRDKSAIFSINREGEPDHVLTSVELNQGTRPTRAVSLATTQRESELLHNEMEIMSRDLRYEETVKEAANLLLE